MEDFFDRLDKFMLYKGLNDNKMTVQAGLSVGSLGKQRKGARGLSNDSIAKILYVYSELDANWLLTGKGNMLKGQSETEENTSLNNVSESDVNYKRKRNSSDSEIDNQAIPYYEIEAVAGLNMLFDNQNSQIPIDYINVPNAPKCDGALSIRGDSMYPILKAGDIICYKIIREFQDVRFGEMYLLDIEDSSDRYLTVKYIQRSDLGDDYYKLVSHNPNHQPKDELRTHIKAIGIVKISIRYNTIL